MRKGLQQLTMTIALAALTVAAPALARQAAPSQPRQEAPKAAAALQASGSLVDVNANAKAITIKTAEGKEMKFTYADDTEVVGADRGVSGLATMSGSDVTVTYTSRGAANIATKIEVRAKQ